VATVVIWVRSRFIPENLRRIFLSEDGKWVKGHDLNFWSGGGAITISNFVRGRSIKGREVFRKIYMPYVEDGWVWEKGEESRDPFPTKKDVSAFRIELLAFRFYYGKWQQDTPPAQELWWAVTIPYWFLVLVLATLPAVEVRRFWRKNRSIDRCPNCSYNLTGNNSGVCPECGSPIPKTEPISVSSKS
jgi:hypothetical protein